LKAMNIHRKLTEVVGGDFKSFFKGLVVGTHDWWLRGRIRIILLTFLFGYDVNWHSIRAIIWAVLLLDYMILASRRWLVRVWVGWVLLAAGFCVATGSYF